MGYGQGSLDERPNGKYRARYWGPDGKQHSQTFDRKTDARRFLALMSTDKQRGSWLDPKDAAISFETWAKEWFRGRHTLGNASRARDDSLLRNHVLPAFGGLPIGQVTALQVRSWVNTLVKRGLAPRTIRDCHRIFAAIMRSAVDAKLIPDAPIGRGVVDLPKPERKRERFLTEAELIRLVAAMPLSARVLVQTAAHTGCRWQELTGLKRRHLDLDKGHIHVRGVIERVGGTIRYKEHPKSDAGRRTVTLTPSAVKLLKAHIGSAKPHEYVFAGRDGGLIRESNFRDRVWNPSVALFVSGLSPERGRDLAGMTFHDLRHTHVAWLIREGVQEFKIVKRLGWKDSTMLHRVYGHLFPNSEDSLVELLETRWVQALQDSESAKVIQLRA